MIIKDNNRTDLGIVSFMAFPEVIQNEKSWPSLLGKIIMDDFFSFVEIAHIEDKKIRDKVKKMLEIANIKTGFDAHTLILSNDLNINSSDEEHRQHSIEILKSLIDEAYYMGSECFALLSGPRPAVELYDKEVENIIDSLNTLCLYAFKRASDLGIGPIDIVIETFDEKEFAKNRFVGSTEMAVGIAEKVLKEYDNFGLVLDLSHLPIQEEEFKVSVPMAGKYLKNVHIGNCIISDKEHVAYGDNHPRFCVGSGENDIEVLTEFIRTLLEIDYFKRIESKLTFEVKPLPGEDAELTIAGSKRALNRALNRI